MTPYVHLAAGRLGLALLILLACLGGGAARAQDVQGPPAPGAQEQQPLVTSIEFVGQQRYSARQLRDALGQRIDAPLDPEAIDNGIELLWKSFYVRADVRQIPSEGGVALIVAVVELPEDLEPRFIGNEEIDTEELLEWAHLTDKNERGLYLHEAPRVRQRLLEGYREDGFYFAEVREVIREGGVDDQGNEIAPDVIFEIVEGPRVRVKNIYVHGNQSFPDRGFWLWADGLKHLARMELSTPGLFNWYGDRFVEETLRADLIALRQVYRDRGFLDAVVELDRLEFRDDKSGVDIHIIVDEGTAYTVDEVSLEAVELQENPRGPGYPEIERPGELIFDQAELIELLELKPGVRYEKTRVDADRRALQEYYGARGHISHPSLGLERSYEFRDPLYVFDTENHTVDVTYRLAQGKKIRIREVLFAGATHTRDRVLRREVTVEEGEQADLEKIQRSLRRLRATGYFSDPRNPLEHQEPTFRFVPTDDPDVVDLEFIVEEGSVVDFQISGGVDSNNGLFGIISLTMRNFDAFDLPDSFLGMFGEIYRKEAFHGAGQRLDVQFSPGTAVNFTRLHFVEPDIFRTHRQRYVLDLEFLDRDRRFREYDEARIRRQIKLGRVFAEDWTVFLGYANSDVSVDDLDEDEELPPALVEQSMVGVTDLRAGSVDLVYRDIDSRVNPRDGLMLRWNNTVNGSFFGGDADFYQTDVTADWYLPTTDDPDVKPGFHLSLGAGIAIPFGDTEDTPYTERFFLGGLTTLRGFRFRGVGPNTADTPDGGQTMLRGSIEYGHPLYSITRPGTYDRVEMVRFIVFLDAGVLDETSGALDFDETRVSTGFGFGLTQPFPIVFNFGWPLRDGDGDRTQVFSFNLAFL